jgi:hypothetical protein
LLCLIYDPGLFEPLWSKRSSHGDFQVFLFLAIVYQMIMFFAWLIGQWWLRRSAGFFTGTFAVGVVCAAGVGIVFLPFAIFGTIMLGVGLPGWAPWLTAWAFFSNARKAYRRGKFFGSNAEIFIYWLGGSFLALAIPYLIYFFAGDWLCETMSSVPWHGTNGFPRF